MREPLMAGNWKMHKTCREAVELVKDLWEKVKDLEGVEVAVCPPFTALADVSSFIKKSGAAIKLGAQNVYPRPEGAFTGEISPLMLVELGIEYVIVGHSERREIMKEVDDFVAEKIKAVLEKGMTPILCVGETLEEREAEEAKSKVEGQLKEDMKHLGDRGPSSLVIAYEPIWAIGTGKTSTPEDAQEMTSFIRNYLSQHYGEEEAGKVRILYGGSVKPDNVSDLMSQDDIDGALVGGASLEADSFSRIARF